MFNLFKGKMGFGKKEIEITAPTEGTIVPITEVNDPIFSGKVIGEGIAIKPTKGRVVSPVSGQIDTIFETGHAVSIKSDDGVEILIHVGIDTVKLNGKFYKSYTQNGAKVKKGDLLIEFDFNEIENAGYDSVTIIAICNSDEFVDFKFSEEDYVRELENIIFLQKKN